MPVQKKPQTGLFLESYSTKWDFTLLSIYCLSECSIFKQHVLELDMNKLSEETQINNSIDQRPNI